MKNVEYEVDGVIYGVTSLQAGTIDRLEGSARDDLIRRTAVAKRDKDEPEAKAGAKTKVTSATQGPVSTLLTKGQK